jgi:multidrug efflux system membrane fusion protein
MKSIVCLLVVVSACGKDETSSKSARGRGPVKFPVDVMTVEARPVEYAIRAVGTVDVFERVQVTASVSGAVEKVSFQAGQVVKVGEVLATIEPARYSLAARQASAAVDRAKAALADAEAGLARRVDADKANPGLIPGEEIETWRTKVATAKADLAERQVARDRAGLDLRDAYVRAPIAGELQTRTVETGQYVQPGVVIATMVRRDPLQLKFAVPELDAGPLASAKDVSFTIEGSTATYHALIKHVAAVADAASRTVFVTAEIDDPKKAELRAGGFAQVSVPIAGGGSAPVIPETAVRPSERGFLTYIVDGETARERIVELGLRTPDGLVEVKSGLAVGDKLVVRGAEALREGALVKIGGTPPGKPGAGSGAGSGSGSGPKSP